jgi:hypothetical protein
MLTTERMGDSRDPPQPRARFYLWGRFRVLGKRLSQTAFRLNNSSQLKSSQVRSSQVQSRQAKPSLAKSGQVKSGQAKSSEVKSGQVKSRQVTPSQVKPSQVRSSQAKSSPSWHFPRRRSLILRKRCVLCTGYGRDLSARTGILN